MQAAEGIANAASGVRAQDEAESDRPWILSASAFVIIFHWFGLISGSLWLDETGTWWIVKDGLREVVERAVFWSGQSPLYYLIAWTSSRLFGLNEIALRAPSTLMMAGAVYFLYRIAEELLDRAAAAVTAFLFLWVAAYYAVDARPYALALLCLNASTWFLLRWVKTNRVRDAVLYVVASALLVYAHVVLALGLGVGIVFAIVALRKEPRRLAWLTGCEIAVVLLSIPLLGELRTFYANRAAYTLLDTPPSLPGLVPALLPGSFTGGVILAVWVAMTLRREASVGDKYAGRTGLLIGAWALGPPVVLYILVWTASVHLFLAKYYASSLAGQALLLGGLLASIERRVVRNALIASIAFLVLLTSGKMTGDIHGSEDWRGALTFLRKEAGSAPVLLVCGFVEGSSFTRINDPKMRDVLFAPELLYGQPDRTIRLPNVFDGAANPYMERIAQQLRKEPRFFFLTENPNRRYEMWLLGAMASAGKHCGSDDFGTRFGNLYVSRFTCE